MLVQIKHLRLLLLAALFSCGGLTLSAQMTIAQTDFMRVPAGGGAEYVAMEKEIWKPLHQERVNRGELQGWYLFSVRFAGTDAEYQYVTVNVYNDRKQLDAPLADMEGMFKKVHPNVDMEKAMNRTGDSRDLIKTYVSTMWEGTFAEDLKEPAKFISLAFFKIPPGGAGAYRDMEKKYYLPMHKASIEAGEMVGWAGYQMRRPVGSSAPYNYVAVNYFKDYQQWISGNGEEIRKKVHPNSSWYELNQKAIATRELVKVEDWRLIDYVQAPPPSAETKK